MEKFEAAQCNCDSCQNKLCASKVPIFSFLSEAELLKIVGKTGHMSFKTGDVLCHEGEGSDKLLIIRDGQVKLSKLTKDGKEQIIHILSSGDFLGELSLLSGNEKYNFTAYAITEVKLCTLTKKDMDEIILDNPEISLKILKEVTMRLIETENLAQNLATNDAEIRIASMLIEFAEKFGTVKGNKVYIRLPINREEMANYTGVTRETISRKLSSLEAAGIIQQSGNKTIILKDIASLKKYID